MIEKCDSENGKLQLLLDAGHAEYGIPDLKPSRFFKPVRCTYMQVEDDAFKPIPHVMKLAKKLAHSPNNWLDPENEEELKWTTIVRVSGTVSAHVRAFTLLAATLTPSLDPSGHTPGGDDDYYDYYPSGLRLLREWAMDLDEAMGGEGFYSKPGFLAVYHFVLRDFISREKERFRPFEHGDYKPEWHEMEEVEDRIDELAADLNKPREEVVKEF